MIVERRILQHGGGNREHESLRNCPPEGQDIVDVEPVNSAVSTLEGMQENEPVRYRSGMDNSWQRTFFYPVGGNESVHHS